MDNNINIFFSEKNYNNDTNDKEYTIDDFLLVNNDNNDNNDVIYINDTINYNNYSHFLSYTEKLTKYDAIRAGYGELLSLYYDERYLVADLLRICDYYGLLKTIKSLKCKKQEIVDTIVHFETDIANKDIVDRRHQLWSYIMELKEDKYMKQFIAF
jgi:hypothetical protein